MILDARTYRRIQKHMTALSSPEIKIAARAESNLIRFYRARAFDLLLDACTHPDPQVRFRSGWVLGHTHDSRAYDAILKLTKDPDGFVRYDAAIALGILGDPRAVEPLIDLMSVPDPQDAVDSAAATGMVRPGKIAVPAPLRTLQGDNSALRRTAASVLGGINDPSAVEPISHLLLDPDDRTRIAGIDSLAEIGTARCLSLIKSCLQDPSEQVSDIAAYWYHDLANALGQDGRSKQDANPVD